MSVRNAAPGSNAERSRAYNRGVVLGHIRQQGDAGRAEIARASGLSTQAVSNIIADLLAEGWVYEAGRRAGGRGLPAVTYAIRAAAGAAFGLEIRPGALLGALIDLEGRALFTHRVALKDARPEHVLPLTAEMLERGFSDTGLTRDRLIGAGAVMPGPFGRTGLSGQGTDLPGWEGIDTADLLGRVLGLPVTVENDANAAAMAERISGVAQEVASYAYLYFGTGLGLGVVSDGRVYRGAFGNAGEIGHIPVPTPDGPRPLEDLASRIALGRRMAAAGLPGDTIDDLERLHADDAHPYRAWRAEALMALGHAVQVIENLFDPETIILGGAMPAPILRDLARNVPLPQASVANRPDRDLPRLMAGRAGRMTATIGAAALVVNSMLSPRLADTG